MVDKALKVIQVIQVATEKTVDVVHRETKVRMVE